MAAEVDGEERERRPDEPEGDELGASERLPKQKDGAQEL
jgi:hypothetical protein